MHWINLVDPPIKSPFPDQSTAEGGYGSVLKGKARTQVQWSQNFQNLCSAGSNVRTYIQWSQIVGFIEFKANYYFLQG